MLMTIRNGVTLQELELCDLAVTPTAWQHQQFPGPQRSKLQVVFDGVDTQLFRPVSWSGTIELDGDGCVQPLKLEPDHRVLSYATRGMEPLRGFPEFMRMLPELMNRFPDLQVWSLETIEWLTAMGHRAMAAAGSSTVWRNWLASSTGSACTSPVC